MHNVYELSNYYMILLDGRTTIETREKLKRADYRWYPAINGWLAKKNENRLAVARDIIHNPERYTVTSCYGNAQVDIDSIGKNSCYHNNVNDYIRYDFAEFLDMMQENYYRVTDHELNFGQYAAWGNSHYNFLRFFEKLHRIDPNDQILMEAVVDLKTKWRADIIYIHKDKMMLIENKQDTKVDFEDYTQIKKYCRQLLINYPCLRHLEIQPIIIPTLSKGINKKYQEWDTYNIIVTSPDVVLEKINDIFY